MQRAVVETVEALQKEGHECIEFPVPDSKQSISKEIHDIHSSPSALRAVKKASQIFLALVLADGNKTLFSPIGRDPRVSPGTFF